LEDSDASIFKAERPENEGNEFLQSIGPITKQHGITSQKNAILALCDFQFFIHGLYNNDSSTATVRKY
jgi:hypothetical protein